MMTDPAEMVSDAKTPRPVSQSRTMNFIGVILTVEIRFAAFTVATTWLTNDIVLPMAEKTILFAGGGTGGHLYPGIAVAEQIRMRSPGSRIVFLCTKREIDKVILSPTGFEFIPQPIVPPVTTIGGLLKFWKSWRETKDLVRQILKDNRPAAVLGLGGYAAGVAVKMAAGRKIPTAILNPDVIPGKANQFLMKYTDAVCCQFEQTAEHVPAEFRSRLHITGCPIRSDISRGCERAAAMARLGLQSDLHTLVITGASLGAQTVNEAVLTLLAKMPIPGWQVLHLAGRDHSAAVKAEYEKISVAASLVDFTPAMADVWAVADLCISRSGASSCAELTACGVPSLLMPYPYHKDMHQRANARVLADAGAAVLVDDEKDREKNAAKIRTIIAPLLSDQAKRQAMSNAAKQLGKPNAAAMVGDLIQSIS
jgi:UDP-N-acetylglucosamine--N-acetylmuramyl-(pentapeptide) pyrophosphoryl-undecaprenol N-acetylglucosamine transferase